MKSVQSVSPRPPRPAKPPNYRFGQKECESQLQSSRSLDRSASRQRRLTIVGGDRERLWSLQSNACARPSTSPLGVMRQRDTPPCAIDASARLRLSLRRLVIWSHVVVGIITLFIYLGFIDFSRIPGGAGSALWVAVPVLVPYAISAGYFRQL